MRSISYIMCMNMNPWALLWPYDYPHKREENAELYDFNCGVILTYHKYICIIALTTLKMATWVAETCRWLLCNKIVFIKPSAFVGLSINSMHLITAQHMEHTRQIKKYIIYNKPTRCNSGSIVFINNYKHALHVSDSLCVHHQEHYKL